LTTGIEGFSDPLPLQDEPLSVAKVIRLRDDAARHEVAFSLKGLVELAQPVR
jgi:hypothetical protein